MGRSPFDMLLILAVASSASAYASEAVAQQRTIHLGALVGPNFSQLNQPTDPEGAVTVLGGTAFNGTGITAGATGAIQLLDVPYGALSAELNALYSFQRATGFAESRETGARRELTIKTDVFRVPLLARYDIIDDPISLRVGVGPELLFGFSSDHSVTQTGVEAPPTGAFTTTPVTHVGITTKLGATYEGTGWRVPVDFRFTWDPMVGPSTGDRLEGFQDFENPGQYQVAYDLQFMVVVGVEFDLGADVDFGRAVEIARSAAARYQAQQKNERSEPPGEGPPSPVASEGDDGSSKKSQEKKTRPEQEKPGTTAEEEPGAGDTAATQNVEIRELRDSLWVDCREKPKHDRCARPSWLEPGAFGSGPPVGVLPGFGARMTDGFVDYQTGELIVGAEWTIEDPYGYIVAVDLESGDREIISGRHENKESGDLTDIGSGEGFGPVYDVELGPDGEIYAYWAPDEGKGTPHISRVDRKTGKRELVWAADDDDYGQCITTGDRAILPISQNFAIGSSGEFYVASSNTRPKGSGWGILRITADGSACEFVSISSSEHGNDVGSGDENQAGEITRIEMVGGTLWATHGQTQSIWAFNPGDGTRKRVSSSSNTVGTGSGEAKVGTAGLAWVPAREKFLTSGRGRDNVLTWVDPTSGARERVEINEGSMEVGVFDSSPVFVHPSGKLTIHIVDDDAVVLFDPETGVSNLLSL